MMRERNHFDGRPHRYKAFCTCQQCDQETRRRVTAFWSLPGQEQKEMLAQLTEKRPHDPLTR